MIVSQKQEGLMFQKSSVTRIQKLLIYLYVFATYFNSLRIDEHVLRIHTDYLLITFFFLFFLFHTNSLKIDSLVVLVLLSSISYSLIMPLFEGYSSLEATFWTFQYHVLLFIVVIIARSINFADFTLVWEDLTKYFLFGFYIFYFLSFFGFSISVDRTGLGGLRPHGFLTEPSNIAFLLPPMSILLLSERKILFALLCICGSLITLSPIVILTLLFGFLIFILYDKAMYFKLLFGIFSLVLFIFLDRLDTLAISSENDWLNIIERLRVGFLFFGDTDAGYANTRGEMLLDWYRYNEIYTNNLLFGHGLGVSNYLSELAGFQLGVDINFFIILINAYGIVIALFIISIVLFRLYSIRHAKNQFLVASILLFVSLINPAGIYLQMIIVFILFTPTNKLQHVKDRYCYN